MLKITLLAQMIQLLPAEKFKKLANELESNKHSKGIDSWTHLVTMLFCHLSNAASCRDISNGLMSIAGNINIILPESWTRGLVKKSLNLTKRYDQTNPTQIHA